MQRQIRISFIGPSGSGKSTCRTAAERFLSEAGYEVFRCDVASPLHVIQAFAQRVFGLEYDESRQDGELLSFLAGRFQDHLMVPFTRRITQLTTRHRAYPIALVNTDCRNNAYSVLRQYGFIFIRVLVSPNVLAERRERRGDHTRSDPTSVVEQCDWIDARYAIRNDGSLHELDASVHNVLETILR